ncbi:hypothetical protein [Agriterribacter sp.]|uniref:hypothetical protein n=1 Tax=Agriterribacter sp. TaxID=2821509 RepID=UPI002CEE5CD4|nr:hypothetical protein [Agriterribacter sp.]HRP57227.1 hypothetical protein [Agriterribacter sp.]
MRSRKKPGSVITLLLVIVAIIILHALRDIGKDDDNRKRSVDAALTGEITRY